MKCFIKLQIPLKQGQCPDPYEGDMALVLPRFIPFDNSGWGEISSNSPREKQGSLYDTNPNNALH